MTEKANLLKDAEVMMHSIAGRKLRVARWRAQPSQGKGKPAAALPLLFFNGIGANIELVAPFARQLGQRDFIIFDMPGIGESADPILPYNPITMSQTAAELMTTLGYDRMDVMGVSWGGAMAQHFAMQYPGRVDRLILAATTAGWMMVPGKLSALTKMANPRRYIDPDFMSTHFATLYGGKNDSADGHVGRIRPPSGVGYLYQLLAMVGWTSAPLLPFLLKAQTLVLMGEEDNIVPVVNGRFLASLIPDAELRIIKDGGHLFLVSQAEESLTIINEFLDRPRAPRPDDPAMDAPIGENTRAA